ncbi:pleckstrin homology domain-containing family F member 1-like [Acanthochromis polyacanthus]|uniref:Pleckstrin homology and FYVE domain containing 1 n=1 Tax=Acanthochromis polyacanthus TaxID=80966 RepID=A0A3Q1FRN3_9TELE|nr:pleckstrin homology domain-containing family F member 1-like [Acanthochromis polyacanthus]
MDKLTFKKENSERIQMVENSFGPSGVRLCKPDRILIGEGRLIKQGRKKQQPKAFFLFNDILVYGSIILNGRWHKKQKIIPLEDIMVEDMEDSEGFMHQWLIRTPSKSFFVSAFSADEKQAWLEHIKECQSNLLQDGRRLGSNFAMTWIPDRAAEKCMRCFSKFSATKRRHHCRKCGFLVCNSCSKERVVIHHIHRTKRLRICSLCHTERSRQRGNSAESNSSEEEEEVNVINNEEEEEELQSHTPSNWLDSRMGSWGHNFSPEPMHQ